MFYGSVYKGQLNFQLEPHDMGVAIDDDFENRFLYSYDEKRNKIIKKERVDYVVEEYNGSPVLIFDIDSTLYLNVKFQTNDYMVERQACVFFNSGKPSMFEFDVKVNGTLIIESKTDTHAFIPIVIKASDLISDDPNPIIEVGLNKAIVKPHPYYEAIDEMKKEIKKLKGE